MKKWMVITIIAILFVATILFAFFINAPKVSGEENVDMKLFNETVEKLNVAITDMQTNIDTLKATNNDLQAEIEVLNNKVSVLENQTRNNTTLISNTILRTTKIEARETKLYDILLNNYYTQWSAAKMKDFIKTQ